MMTYRHFTGKLCLALICYCLKLGVLNQLLVCVHLFCGGENLGVYIVDDAVVPALVFFVVGMTLLV